MNPYLHPVWSKWIHGAHHGGVQALQNLTLHLYNSRDWSVNLGYICSMSEDHWDAALAMILDYRGNGENNREFMVMCEEIVERADAAPGHLCKSKAALWICKEDPGHPQGRENFSHAKTFTGSWRISAADFALPVRPLALAARSALIGLGPGQQPGHLPHADGLDAFS